MNVAGRGDGDQVGVARILLKEAAKGDVLGGAPVFVLLPCHLDCGQLGVGNARFGVRIGLTRLQTRFYIDPATGLPHIYDHQVDEDEVTEVLEKPYEDRAGRDGSRIALGQTASGRYLRVIYVPDSGPNSVFVITAYELAGKPLTAFRRRRRKKQQ